MTKQEFSTKWAAMVEAGRKSTALGQQDSHDATFSEYKAALDDYYAKGAELKEVCEQDHSFYALAQELMRA